jgi:hypothetical protein
MTKINRASALAGIGAAALWPTGVLGASVQEQKRAFIAQCDESISIERLAGAPHKFVGKKVDLHGIVGPAMEDTHAFNLDSGDSPWRFVVVIWNAKNLEERQRVRVLGVVLGPVSGQTTTGGSGTFAVVRARYVE